jgi:hypothetical protein
MPKKRKSKQSQTPAIAKSSTKQEVENLRRQLSEAQQHRNLLIETLHGLAASGAKSLTASPVSIAASPSTLATLRSIIASYGICPHPDNATVVGPNVTSMQQFTLDVNTRFGRSYVYGQLQSSWDISQTGVFIDNNP